MTAQLHERIIALIQVDPGGYASIVAALESTAARDPHVAATLDAAVATAWDHAAPLCPADGCTVRLLAKRERTWGRCATHHYAQHPEAQPRSRDTSAVSRVATSAADLGADRSDQGVSRIR